MLIVRGPGVLGRGQQTPNVCTDWK